MTSELLHRQGKSDSARILWEFRENSALFQTFYSFGHETDPKEAFYISFGSWLSILRCQAGWDRLPFHEFSPDFSQFSKFLKIFLHNEKCSWYHQTMSFYHIYKKYIQIFNFSEKFFSILFQKCQTLARDLACSWSLKAKFKNKKVSTKPDLLNHIKILYYIFNPLAAIEVRRYPT